MNSKDMRENSLFLRNEFEEYGRWGIPFIRKQIINLEGTGLIAYSSIKKDDKEENKRKGVHFFIDDYRFNSVYSNPDKSWDKLSQYSFIWTPDFSTDADMPLWRQLESVAHSRWCGAKWQSKNANVVTTITWSTPISYDFCFDGVEKESIVAVGMIGCKKRKRAFLHGYDAMLERVNPSAVICFGKPYREMRGNIIEFEYKYPKGGGR